MVAVLCYGLCLFCGCSGVPPARGGCPVCCTPHTASCAGLMEWRAFSTHISCFCITIPYCGLWPCKGLMESRAFSTHISYFCITTPYYGPWPCKGLMGWRASARRKVLDVIPIQQSCTGLVGHRAFSTRRWHYRATDPLFPGGAPGGSRCRPR